MAKMCFAARLGNDARLTTAERHRHYLLGNFPRLMSDGWHRIRIPTALPGNQRHGGFVRGLIVDLYQSASDPNPLRIQKALAGIGRHMDVDNIMFAYWQNGTFNSVNSQPETNELPELYANYYQHIDPRLRDFTTIDIGKLYLCHEHFDDAYVSHSEIFQDFLIPNKRRFVMATKLASNANLSACIAINHFVGRPAFMGRKVEQFKRLIPHLVNWIGVVNRMRQIESQQETFEQALLQSNDGIAIVDARQRVVFANPRALTLLVRAPKGGHLALRGDSHGTFPAALAHALRTRAGVTIHIRSWSGETPLTIELRLLPLPADGFAPSPDRTTVGSLFPGDDRVGRATFLRSHNKTCVLMIMRVLRKSAKDAHFLREQMRLTRAETVVAIDFFDGVPVAEIASRRGTSLRTLRTQMRSIMLKFGAGTLQDLLRMSAWVPSAPDFEKR